MHPVIMRQLAADHISETHARAREQRTDARPGRLAGPGQELADDQGKGEDSLLSSFNI